MLLTFQKNGSIITIQIMIIRISIYAYFNFFGGLTVKKYEALDLEIISVSADVVLASFGDNADSPFITYDPSSSALKDLGLLGD